jgi:hypothetical protein
MHTISQHREQQHGLHPVQNQPQLQAPTSQWAEPWQHQLPMHQRHQLARRSQQAAAVAHQQGRGVAAHQPMGVEHGQEVGIVAAQPIIRPAAPPFYPQGPAASQQLQPSHGAPLHQSYPSTYGQMNQSVAAMQQQHPPMLPSVPQHQRGVLLHKEKASQHVEHQTLGTMQPGWNPHVSVSTTTSHQSSQLPAASHVPQAGPSHQHSYLSQQQGSAQNRATPTGSRALPVPPHSRAFASAVSSVSQPVPEHAQQARRILLTNRNEREASQYQGHPSATSHLVSSSSSSLLHPGQVSGYQMQYSLFSQGQSVRPNQTNSGPSYSNYQGQRNQLNSSDLPRTSIQSDPLLSTTNAQRSATHQRAAVQNFGPTTHAQYGRQNSLPAGNCDQNARIAAVQTENQNVLVLPPIIQEEYKPVLAKELLHILAEFFRRTSLKYIPLFEELLAGHVSLMYFVEQSGIGTPMKGFYHFRCALLKGDIILAEIHPTFSGRHLQHRRESVEPEFSSFFAFFTANIRNEKDWTCFANLFTADMPWKEFAQKMPVTESTERDFWRFRRAIADENSLWQHITRYLSSDNIPLSPESWKILSPLCVDVYDLHAAVKLAQRLKEALKNCPQADLRWLKSFLAGEIGVESLQRRLRMSCDIQDFPHLKEALLQNHLSLVEIHPSLSRVTVEAVHEAGVPDGKTFMNFMTSEPKHPLLKSHLAQFFQGNVTLPDVCAAVDKAYSQELEVSHKNFRKAALTHRSIQQKICSFIKSATQVELSSNISNPSVGQSSTNQLVQAPGSAGMPELSQSLPAEKQANFSLNSNQCIQAQGSTVMSELAKSLSAEKHLSNFSQNSNQHVQAQGSIMMSELSRSLPADDKLLPNTQQHNPVMDMRISVSPGLNEDNILTELPAIMSVSSVEEGTVQAREEAGQAEACDRLSTPSPILDDVATEIRSTGSCPPVASESMHRKTEANKSSTKKQKESVRHKPELASSSQYIFQFNPVKVKHFESIFSSRFSDEKLTQVSRNAAKTALIKFINGTLLPRDFMLLSKINWGGDLNNTANFLAGCQPHIQQAVFQKKFDLASLHWVFNDVVVDVAGRELRLPATDVPSPKTETALRPHSTVGQTFNLLYKGHCKILVSQQAISVGRPFLAISASELYLFLPEGHSIPDNLPADHPVRCTKWEDGRIRVEITDGLLPSKYKPVIVQEITSYEDFEQHFLNVQNLHQSYGMVQKDRFEEFCLAFEKKTRLELGVQILSGTNVPFYSAMRRIFGTDHQDVVCNAAVGSIFNMKYVAIIGNLTISFLPRTFVTETSFKFGEQITVSHCTSDTRKSFAKLKMFSGIVHTACPKQVEEIHQLAIGLKPFSFLWHDFFPRFKDMLQAGRPYKCSLYQREVICVASADLCVRKKPTQVVFIYLKKIEPTKVPDVIFKVPTINSLLKYDCISIVTEKLRDDLLNVAYSMNSQVLLSETEEQRLFRCRFTLGPDKREVNILIRTLAKPAAYSSMAASMETENLLIDLQTIEAIAAKRSEKSQSFIFNWQSLLGIKEAENFHEKVEHKVWEDSPTKSKDLQASAEPDPVGKLNAVLTSFGPDPKQTLKSSRSLKKQ